jgi:hypothetical protein
MHKYLIARRLFVDLVLQRVEKCRTLLALHA